MEIATWWHDFQNADHQGREALLIPGSGPRKRRRRVRGKKAVGEGAASPEALLGDEVRSSSSEA